MKSRPRSLPKLFQDTDTATARLLYQGEKLADGGAAMIAWARMQFTAMSDQEREELSAALLKYCELDTFAMVMIYEYWAHECRSLTTLDRGA